MIEIDCAEKHSEMIRKAETKMKAQKCTFQRKKDSVWEPGIAILEIFDLYDIKSITDQHGEKVAEFYNYNLISGPMCYLDTMYQV